MRKFMNIVTESDGGDIAPVLYHGTCPANAAALIANGWEPRSGQQGANMGQSRYLYLTTGKEDALWFAEEKGCSTVIEIRDVPKAFLRVDPEDGTGDTVDDELHLPHGLPGKVVLTRPLPASHFRTALDESAAPAVEVKVWHVTPKTMVGRILRQGLLPKVGPRSRSAKETLPAIYVFPDFLALEDGISNWLGDAFDENTALSVLELTVPRDWLHQDAVRYECTITQPVPAERIKLLIPDIDDWTGGHPDGAGTDAYRPLEER